VCAGVLGVCLGYGYLDVVQLTDSAWYGTFQGLFVNPMSTWKSEKLATVLIVVGVAAWIPYFILKFLLGQEITVYLFLAVHLSGVVPGALLRRWDLILLGWRRLRSR